MPREEGKLKGELDKLTKAVEGLAAKVAMLETLVTAPGGADELRDQIDRGFEAMGGRLETALAHLPAASTKDRPPPPIYTPPKQPPSGDESPSARATPGEARLPAITKDVLLHAYERLCHFREFQDGLVELPRLFHEARKKLPGLTVAEFHRELDGLWSRREVELHVLNEVQRASEPDKGIRRDDYLYYYVFWNRP